VLTVVALVVWGLKRHYADARADDLSWILGPTAWLVGVTTNTAFAFVSDEGYVSHARLFIIEKSCAGINFMIAAFGMLVCALFHRVSSAVSAASVLAVSLAASYGSAVVVNTARIGTAMWLADHPVGWATLSAADVHRIEGIAVYFTGLLLLYACVERLDRCAVVERYR
jgi:exosortase K